MRLQLTAILVLGLFAGCGDDSNHGGGSTAGSAAGGSDAGGSSAGGGDVGGGGEAPGSLFDMATIHEIEIELSPESFAAIDAEAEPIAICAYHERNYYRGNLIFDGVRYDGVGVKARGNGTADTLGEKPSLKINLEWDDPDVPGCPEERRIEGKKKLNLINMRQDPSFVRIPLAGELDRLVGAPQPRTSYARLGINGQYTGIVVNSENIDRRFLAEQYPSNDGAMYEAGCSCDISEANVPAPDAEDGPLWSLDFHNGPCDTPGPSEDPLDWELLRDFAAQVAALPPGGLYPEIGSFFDFDEFLSLWAATMFFGSGDGYFRNQNSYRIYHDPSTDLFHLIDHGSADGIMRTFSDSCSADGLLVMGDQPNVFTTPDPQYDSLTARCLAEPDCKAAYAARSWEVLHAFEGFGLEARASELHDFIIDDMMTDPRYYYAPCVPGQSYTFPELEAHFTDYVLPWTQGRFANVRQQLESAGYPEP